MMQEKEDRMLEAQVGDRIRQCEEQYAITHTEFLDLHQHSVAAGILQRESRVRHGFYGGYDGAERCIAVFLPDYIMQESPSEHFREVPEDDPLCVLRITLPKGASRLSHRDYLGALMSIGIRRDVTGDILVHDQGADLIVLRSISSFICTNLVKAGHARLSIAEEPVSALSVPELRTEERHVSVSSMRADSLVSAAFGLSRTKAADAVRGGLVFADGLEVSRPDRLLTEGCKLVGRHRGKAVIRSIDGTSAKGRIHVTILRYR